jgi:hypothetical protein
MAISTSYVPNVSAGTLNQIVRLISGLPGGPVGFRDSVENWVSAINALYEQGSVAVTVANETGGPLSAGDQVYISAYDSTSGYPEVTLADANAIGKPAMYVLLADIADGSQGQAAQVATVDGIDTSGVLEDDILYLSPTATTGNTWTKTAPPSGASVQQQIVGVVETVSATNGRIRFDLASSGVQRQEADRIMIADAGGLFVGADTEAALQEIRTTCVSKATVDATAAVGVLALTQAVMTARGEGAAADDVDTLTLLGTSGWAFLVTGAEAVTYRDFSVGAGNISTPRNSSIVTATGDIVLAVRVGALVYVMPVMTQAGLSGGLLGPAVTADLLVLLATDQITNAVLIQAILNGAFQADAATRALFAARCLSVDKITGIAAQANTPAAATATLTGIGTFALDDGAGAFNLDTIAGLDDGEWAWLTIGDIAHPVTIRDNAAGGGNIWTQRAASIVLASLEDAALVVRDGVMYKVIASSIQAGQASGAPSANDTGAATATNVAEERSGMVRFLNPIAAEVVSIVANVLCADGAQIIAGQPDYPRCLQVDITIATNPITDGDVTIVGVGASGEALNEVIDITTAISAVFETDYAYATVTSVTVSGLAGGAGAGDNIGVGVSSKLGLCGCKSPVPSAWAVYKTIVDDADEAVAGVDTTYGTVDPTTAPNGAHDYDFWYTFTVTPTQNSHVHGPGTHTHLI